MTRTELRDEIRRMIRDYSPTGQTSQQRWSDSILNTWIDVANGRVAAMTLAIEARATDTSAVDGTQEYDLPTDFLTERQVLYKQSDGTYVKLIKTTEHEMDLYDSQWRATEGSPSYYYTRLTKLGLYPTPNESRASAIRIDYYKRPAALSADSDYPLAGVSAYYPYHYLLSYDVARRAMLADAKTAEAAIYEGEFQKGIKELKSQIWRDVDETRLINYYEVGRSTSRRTR